MFAYFSSTNEPMNARQCESGIRTTSVGFGALKTPAHPPCEIPVPAS